jgi:hypothetical protein
VITRKEEDERERIQELEASLAESEHAREDERRAREAAEARVAALEAELARTTRARDDG